MPNSSYGIVNELVRLSHKNSIKMICPEKCDSKKLALCNRKLGHMSFRPTPFEPLQFQPLQFQPFTLSTIHTFNRLPFRPLANSTATNSTYSIKFKVIHFFQDVRKQLK